MVSGEGEERKIEFCEGCPSQGSFVGPVTEAAVALSMTYNHGGDDGKQYYFPTPKGDSVDLSGKYMKVTVGLHDEDVGVSQEPEGVYGLDELSGSGIRFSVRKNTLTNGKTVKKQTLALNADTPATIVDRIERCTHPCTKEQKKHCPALNQDVVRALLKKALKNNQGR